MNYHKTVYRLYECQNRVTDRFVQFFTNLNQANDFLSNLLLKERNVLVPVEYVINSTAKSGYAMARKEYLLLRLVKPWEEDQVTTLPNSMGRMTKFEAKQVDGQKIRYQVVRVEPHNVEERFRVVGMTGTKTCQEIYNDLILPHLSEDPYTTVCMMVLSNKLILDYGAEYNYVLCKNPHDAVRLYNAVQKLGEKARQRRLFGFGYVTKDKKGMWRKRMLDAGVPKRIVQTTVLRH